LNFPKAAVRRRVLSLRREFSCDILSPNGRSAWDIVEVKSTTSTKNIHFHGHGFQAWVLTKAGLAINRIFLMHINPDYVLAGEIDPQRFFIKIDVTAQVSH